MLNLSAVDNFHENLGLFIKIISFKFSYNLVKDRENKEDMKMNYFNNYPYGYMNQYPQAASQYLTQSVPPQSGLPQLNGKIVDSEDVVKATEVPIGGYGIFPKADLSEIYIKSWNNNGTTSVITFRPILPEATISADTNTILLQKIEALEIKLDTLLTQEPQKKEVVKNGF